MTELESRLNWKAEKITATGAETKTVHTGSCLLAQMYVTSAVNVTPKDNATAVWGIVNNATKDFSNCPIRIRTSLKLTFAGAADCWVIYLPIF